MNKIRQEKNSLVDMIKQEMDRQGVKSQTELARICEVPQPVVSRFFGGRGMSYENFYLILSCLGMLQGPGADQEKKQKLIPFKRQRYDLVKAEIIKNIGVNIDEDLGLLFALKDRKIRDCIFKVISVIAKVATEDNPTTKPKITPKGSVKTTA